MPVAVLLGLGAALAYGLSDFAAGVLSRTLPYGIVAFVGNGVALAVTVVAFLVAGAAAPSPDALAWGAVSGLGGGFGTLVLYRGLGRGRMGVVAPLSALGAAVLPVVVGVALGDRPTVAAWAGVAIALPAIWLVSTSDEGRPPGARDVERRGSRLAVGVGDGLLAGVAFALLFIGLGLAGDGSGLWPVVASQGSSVTLLVAILAVRVRGRPPGLTPGGLAGAAVVGVFGGVAAIAYYLSAQAGLLSVVAVLTSLYPAVPVVLAAALLHERVGRPQAIGLVLAAVAVSLIVVG